MIPQLFSSDDILYHYCSSNTAINHILKDLQLRISPRKHSADPLENLNYFFSYSANAIELDEHLSDLAYSVERKAKKKVLNAKQLCFCMNDSGKHHTYMNPNFPHEYYGFLKPRMWDQYGDKYRGVCLVFSKSKLLETTIELTSKAIEYLNYSHIPLKHKSIDCADIARNGVDKYWKDYSDIITHSLFHKHLDYKDENEFRIVSFSSDEFDYVNIAPSLIGLIISENYIDQITKETLIRMSKSIGIKAFRIRWGKLGVTVTTQEEHEALIEKYFSNFG